MTERVLVKMLQSGKPQSINIKLMVPILVLVIVQAAVFLIMIIADGTLDNLKNNAYEDLDSRVSRRQVELETLMTDNWGNADNFEPVIFAVEEEYEKNGGENINITKDIATSILDLLRNSKGTGAFVIFDDSIESMNRHHAFYVKDEDPTTAAREYEDVLVDYGIGTIVKDLKLTLNSNWSSSFSMYKENPNFDFYYDIKEAVEKYPQMDQFDLGKWSKPFYLDELSEQIITYTVPLLDNDNKMYGVVGVEIELQYLYNKLPYGELGEDEGGGYILGTSEKGKELVSPIFVVGPTFGNINQQDVQISLHVEDSDYNIFKMKSENIKESISCSSYKLNLYNTNTPFEDCAWYLLGAVKTDQLLSGNAQLKMSIIIGFICALAIGIVVTIYISRRLSTPFKRIIGELENSNPEETVRLSKGNIRELNQLAFAIETLSGDVAYAASRISQIFKIIGLPLGAIEFDRNEMTVLCTEEVGEILEFSEKNRNRGRFTMEEFHYEMEAFYERSVKFRGVLWAEAEIDSVYQTSSGSERRWIRFKKVEHGNKELTVVEDVTEETLEKLIMERERDYDAMTNLLNRRAFKTKVTELIDNGHGNKVGAMVMWDLDNLKYVNDSFGHEYGDKYIKEAAKVFALLSVDGAIVSRVSGDEFFAFFQGWNSYTEIAKKIDAIHKQLGETNFELPSGKSIKVRASGGIARYPGDSMNYDELMKYADFAMYNAKNTYKGRLDFFDKDKFKKDEVLFSGREELNYFIDNSVVRFAFQPIVNARTGDIFAYEALMRPQSENLRSVYDVMRVAKAQGKLYQIEQLTWKGVLEAYNSMYEEFEGAKVFLNSIANTKLLDMDYKNIGTAYKNLVGSIVIEMTESEQGDAECMQIKCKYAEQWGAEMALDDFGAGYNNEGALLTMSPNYVKIDMSIIRGINNDVNRQKIVSNMLSYSRPRGIISIGEGVETKEELDTLLDLGVDMLQGYYLARPDFKLPKLHEDMKRYIQNAKYGN